MSVWIVLDAKTSVHSFLSPLHSQQSWLKIVEPLEPHSTRLSLLSHQSIEIKENKDLQYQTSNNSGEKTVRTVIYNLITKMAVL